MCVCVTSNTGGRTDFARWKFKPKPANSILQALSCRFLGCNLLFFGVTKTIWSVPVLWDSRCPRACAAAIGLLATAREIRWRDGEQFLLLGHRPRFLEILKNMLWGHSFWSPLRKRIKQTDIEDNFFLVSFYFFTKKNHEISFCNHMIFIFETKKIIFWFRK